MTTTTTKTKAVKKPAVRKIKPKNIEEKETTVEIAGAANALEEVKNQKSEKFYEAVGRRKTASARVRLYTKGNGYMVNAKDFKEYFPLVSLQRIIEAPLRKMKSLERFRIEAMVSGGGAHAGNGFLLILGQGPSFLVLSLPVGRQVLVNRRECSSEAKAPSKSRRKSFWHLPLFWTTDLYCFKL